MVVDPFAKTQKMSVPVADLSGLLGKMPDSEAIKAVFQYCLLMNSSGVEERLEGISADDFCDLQTRAMSEIADFLCDDLALDSRRAGRYLVAFSEQFVLPVYSAFLGYNVQPRCMTAQEHAFSGRNFEPEDLFCQRRPYEPKGIADLLFRLPGTPKLDQLLASRRRQKVFQADGAFFGKPGEMVWATLSELDEDYKTVGDPVMVERPDLKRIPAGITLRGDEPFIQTPYKRS